MADDKQAQPPVTETPTSPMPSEEQKTTTGVVSPEAASTTRESEGQETPTGLPDDVKERTQREFEKLQTQLREERARREYAEAVYQSMTPKQTEAQTPIYDPDTGLIDTDQLTDLQRRTNEAERRAGEAEEAIKRYTADQENRQVFTKYPELDPSGKAHDKKLHVETRRIMLDSMVNPDDYGKQLSFMEAADLAKQSPADPESAKRQGAQEALEQLESKEQASLGVQGSSARREALANDDLASLQARTRSGDKQAIIERVRRLNS